MDDVLKFVGGAILFVVILALLVLVLAFPTMWAVNYLFAPGLLTAIFGVAKFDFLRALIFNFFVGAPFLRGVSSKKD